MKTCFNSFHNGSLFNRICLLLFTTFLFVLNGNSANAQINNSILGVLLGKTQKQEIALILPDGHMVHHNSTYERGKSIRAYDTFWLNDVSFAGLEWMKASFEFKDNIVQDVSFNTGPIGALKGEQYYDDLYKALRKKYKKFEKESLDPYFSFFSDGRICIKLDFDGMSCRLTYSSYDQYDLLVKLGKLRGIINNNEL